MCNNTHHRHARKSTISGGKACKRNLKYNNMNILLEFQ